MPRAVSQFFITLLTILLLGSSTAFTQQDRPFRPIEPVIARTDDSPTRAATGLPAAVQSRLDGFFNALQNATPREAFFILFQETKFSENREISDNFVSVTENSFRSYGRMTSHHYWERETTGDRLLTAIYTTEHEFKLLRWRFVFFAPVGREWQLLNLKVDDLRNFLPRNPRRDPPPQDIQLALERFFIQFQGGQIATAYDDFIKGSDIASLKEGNDAFKKQAETAVEAFGSMQSYELFDHRELPNNVHLLTYIVSLEREPLRWQFFYRVHPRTGKWNLFNMRVDDLLDEAILLD